MSIEVPIRRWSSRLKDYWSLTKPEVNFLVVITALVGYDLGSRSSIHLVALLNTLAGTFLVASGTATLNQYWERRFDALMRRTLNRPLPSGRVAPVHALAFGVVLSVAGALYLALAVNLLSSALALATLLSYLLVYTPLKRRTSWCMFVGAFPGAVPPLVGWAAARGSLGSEAWALYAIVFLWQFPHFLSIAWMYREDYSRAGYLMLPKGDRSGRSMAWQVLLCSLVLVPVSLLPAWLGQAGSLYFWGALAVGLWFAYEGARLAAARSKALARRLLVASIAYLPLVFCLMMLDKVRA